MQLTIMKTRGAWLICYLYYYLLYVYGKMAVCDYVFWSTYPGLRKGEAIAVTFFITLIVVAIVTGLIVFLIMWFVCVNKKNRSSSPNNGVNNYHYDKNDEVNSYPSETPPSRPSRPPAPPRPLKPKV